MITEKDLQEAIAECQGQRNPNANTCIKLAAFYTILDHVKGEDQEQEQRDFPPDPPTWGQSFESREIYDSGSEFSQAIADLDINEDVLPIIDELMDTLKVLQPKLYAGVIRKLDGLR